MIAVRRLAEVRAAGDLSWFQPALDRLRSLPGDADPSLRAFFVPEAPSLVARAPGRLDVMGGIADYSGATVLELPLARATTVALQPWDASRCEVMTWREGGWHGFAIDLPPLVDPGGALRAPADLATWFGARARDR